MPRSLRIANDLSIYEDHAEEWWDPNSYYFRSLQLITPFRLGIIKRWFGEVKGRDIIDLGCGGGLLTVPLIALGAKVVGMDISPKSVLRARREAGEKGGFLCGDLRALPLREASADMAILADVLDHVPQYEEVIRDVARVLRPGGKLFVSTINRTWRSWFFAIFLGEGLGLVPKGTHDHSLFITPEELCNAATQAGLRQVAIVGDRGEILKSIKQWGISMTEGRSTAVCYSVLFEK